MYEHPGVAGGKRLRFGLLLCVYCCFPYVDKEGLGWVRRLMKVEAYIKAEQGVSPWLLWVLLRLILCILRRSCKTQQGWLADHPNDASKQTVLLLSTQVCGGARHPVPVALVGTGGTELVALLWGTCRVPSCCCWGQCGAFKHGLGLAPHSCSQMFACSAEASFSFSPSAALGWDSRRASSDR